MIQCTVYPPLTHSLHIFSKSCRLYFNDSPIGNCSIAWVIASGIPISWIPKAHKLKHKIQACLIQN